MDSTGGSSTITKENMLEKFGFSFYDLKRCVVRKLQKHPNVPKSVDYLLRSVTSFSRFACLEGIEEFPEKLVRQACWALVSDKKIFYKVENSKKTEFTFYIN